MAPELSVWFSVNLCLLFKMYTYTFSFIRTYIGICRGLSTENLRARSSYGRARAWPAEGDFNGDGKTDLAINVGPLCNGACRGTNNISLLLGNGDGTFQAPTAVISGNGSLVAADLNGDGNLDLVVASAVSFVSAI
jgi:hypothetical protein